MIIMAEANGEMHNNLFSIKSFMYEYKKLGQSQFKNESCIDYVIYTYGNRMGVSLISILVRWVVCKIFDQYENSIFDVFISFAITTTEHLKDTVLVEGDLGPVLWRVLTAGDELIKRFGPLEQLSIELALLATLDLVTESGALVGVSLARVATESSVALHDLSADCAGGRALGKYLGLFLLLRR